MKLLALLAQVMLPAVGSLACRTSSPSVPLPPSQPLPLSAFTVEFVPAGPERYPPTDTTRVDRFKNVIHFLGDPEDVRTDEKPVRPYVRIGELRLGKNWYSSNNIRELLSTHVPRVGGDAVLVYHAYQDAVAAMQNAETGRMEELYNSSIVLEVIRYTDR